MRSVRRTANVPINPYLNRGYREIAEEEKSVASPMTKIVTRYKAKAFIEPMVLNSIPFAYELKWLNRVNPHASWKNTINPATPVAQMRIESMRFMSCLRNTLETTSISIIPNARVENLSESGSPKVRDTRGAFEKKVLTPKASAKSPEEDQSTIDEGKRTSPCVSNERIHSINAVIIRRENVTSLPNSRVTGKGRNHNGTNAAVIISTVRAAYENLSFILSIRKITT